MQELHQVRLEIQRRNNLGDAFVVSHAVMNSGTCLMFSLKFGVRVVVSRAKLRRMMIRWQTERG
jgi:hypothetical protein